jgi:hypothetical protein
LPFHGVVHRPFVVTKKMRTAKMHVHTGDAAQYSMDPNPSSLALRRMLWA